MRRKFYTKQDYQHMPNGATKRPSANVGAQPVYKVRIPKQLRLEPWDYDYEVPNVHGIQLNFVQPPGGVYEDMDMDDEWEGEFVQGDQDVQPPDDELMEQPEARGERRRREDDAAGGAQRARRANPDGPVFVNPMLVQHNQRGQRRARNQADLEPDLIARVGGRMGGAVRLARANPQETPPRGPRTPGLAVQANRERERVALRTARARRNLDLQQFQRETETRRGQVGLRYNPVGLGNAGLPPRKRGPP